MSNIIDENNVDTNSAEELEELNRQIAADEQYIDDVKQGKIRCRFIPGYLLFVLSGIVVGCVCTVLIMLFLRFGGYYEKIPDNILVMVAIGVQSIITLNAIVLGIPAGIFIRKIRQNRLMEKILEEREPELREKIEKRNQIMEAGAKK